MKSGKRAVRYKLFLSNTIFECTCDGDGDGGGGDDSAGSCCSYNLLVLTQPLLMKGRQGFAKRFDLCLCVVHVWGTANVAFVNRHSHSQHQSMIFTKTIQNNATVK